MSHVFSLPSAFCRLPDVGVFSLPIAFCPPSGPEAAVGLLIAHGDKWKTKKMDEEKKIYTEGKGVQENGGYPTIRQILLVLLAIMLPIQMIGASVQAISPKAALLIIEILILLTVALVIKRARMNPDEVLLLNDIDARIVLLSGLLTLLFSIVVGELDTVLQTYFPMPPEMETEAMKMLIIRDIPDLLLVLICIVIVPSICEEVFFRGMSLTGLMQRCKPVAAVIFSAVVFTIAHMDPWHAVVIFLSGLFLGYMVYRTNSVYTGMVIRLTDHLFFLIAFNLGVYYDIESFKPGVHFPPVVVLFAALFFAIGMVLFHKAIGVERSFQMDDVR